MINGVLWILRTGASWQHLPPRYGPYQTAHRRFQNWVRSGVVEKILLASAARLQEAGGLDLKECFVDETFVPAQKGGPRSAKPNGKGTKIMGFADSHGLSLALRAEIASPAKVKLFVPTLEERVIAEVLERLVEDKAYDSDGLDAQPLRDYGTEMNAPNRRGRKAATQEGRPLRRYIRQWMLERLFAWLFNFRRLVVRYEYHPKNFQGFLHLAAAIILIRH